jgi:hypothetical protein
MLAGDPARAAEDLLACCNAAEASLDPERLERTTTFSAMGLEVSRLLDPTTVAERESVPREVAEQFTLALVREGLHPESSGRAHFVAIALGGCRERHPQAMLHLADMVNSYDDPGLRDLAATNLGRIARPRDVLELVNVPLDRPPSTEDEARVQNGVLTGIYNALGRHREDAADVLPLYEEILLRWDRGPLQDSVREAALHQLAGLRIAGLEPVYEALAGDARHPETAAAARKALRCLREE